MPIRARRTILLLLWGLSGCMRTGDPTRETPLLPPVHAEQTGTPPVAATTGGSATLQPSHLVILANKQVAESQELAHYYAQRRGVPEDRILVLDVKPYDEIDRSSYDQQVAAVIRQFLIEREWAPQVKCLVSVYGVPLRVGAVPPTEEQAASLEELTPQLRIAEKAAKEARERLKKRREANPPAGSAEQKSLQKELRDGEQETKRLRTEIDRLRNTETIAALDSELSLLWWRNYALPRWQFNPLYFQVPAEKRAQAPPVLMVSRLDAATPALVRGLVDQALQAEQKGLNGKVYIDARGLKYKKNQDQAFSYSTYDESLREWARLLRQKTSLEVVLDDRPELFQPGDCPDTALYCGWYSVSRYVDAFTWGPGAVGYHIASTEASNLHRADSQVWCNQMLQRGITATLGPVREPYLLGFPKPAEFFGYLLTGQGTLVECYYRTLLVNSWMMTLIGDPLYNPFRDRPQLSLEDVQPSPAGAPKLELKN